jgi:hypothetical protein
MFELVIIFTLLYILCKLHNVHIIKHKFQGIYLYYEVKKFDMWYKEFKPIVKKIRLWDLDSKDEEPPIF